VTDYRGCRVVELDSIIRQLPERELRVINLTNLDNSMHAEKVLGLTRRILRYANRGNNRFVFLQEVSRMLIDFSSCDAIEILHKDGDLDYRWEARRSPEPTARFETLPESPGGSLAESLKDSTPLGRLCRFVLTGDYDSSLSCFTDSGSLWTNDVNHLPDLILDAIDVPSEMEEKSWGAYRSLALLPFTIDIDNTGLVIFKNAKSGFFTRYEIKFYEGIAQTLGLAAADRRAQAALRERVKELTCLYGIARIAEQQESALEDKLQRIVELLPPSWQHPDIAVARITLDDHTCTTDGFRDGRYRQSATIEVKGERRGIVEVIYVDDKPELEEVPFLKEETSLIDEIARQVGAIVEKAEAERNRIRLQEQLRHADRLATIGQLAAGVAHEINEPLGSILGFTQLAKKNLSGSSHAEPAADLSRDLVKIEKASLHARDIIRNMLIFARQMPTCKSAVNLNKVVEETLPFLESRCNSEGIKLVFGMSDTLPEIEADPSQMNQLLVNLVVNAIQAMPQGGNLTILTDYDEKSVLLSVEDTGIGMSEEVKKQIFDPFFTTKDLGQGTGLGLSVVHGIVTSHGGSIEVESSVNCGSRFRVHLPVTIKVGRAT